MNTLSLIEKIHLLESNLGDRWTHHILEPFEFESSDAIKVQEAAKKIAQHIGLQQLTFIITYADQKPNVGGHINLDDSKEVFIEIDNKFRYDHEIVLAILAHEIYHKYLYFNNLKLNQLDENETLTDITTIYTGLGKLSLNGCEKTSYSSSTLGNTTTKTTTTQKVGYMNRVQFAFVYRLMCEMHKIPKNKMIKGLSLEAANFVNSVSKKSSSYFNEKFFNTELSSLTISDSFKNELGESQKNIAKLNRYIKEIQESILPTAIHLSKEFHSYTKNKIDPLMQSAVHSVTKQPYAYIKNLLILEEFKFHKSMIIGKERELRKLTTTLLKFITYTNSVYSKYLSGKSNEFLFEFECPSCDNKMRIREKKLARVKCQKCSYSFIVDIGTEPTKTIELRKHPQKKFWTQIKSLFNR